MNERDVMLVLGRKVGESFYISHNGVQIAEVKLHSVSIRGARIAIEADREYVINRDRNLAIAGGKSGATGNVNE